MTEDTLKEAHRLQAQKRLFAEISKNVQLSFELATYLDEQYRMQLVDVLTKIRNDIDKRFAKL